MKGIVFNVQRYTIHDGPGIRTEVFLKGCPLDCRWCSNPESKRAGIEPGIYSSRCIGKDLCGLCVSEAEGLCFSREESKSKLVSIDRNMPSEELERVALNCARVCPAEAVRTWGEEMSTGQVMEIVRRDKDYYRRSGGGVTISGGDPAVQCDFAVEIMENCRAEGIHTCVESAFFTDRDTALKLAEAADMIIADIKHMDEAEHIKWTGVSNAPVLENLKAVSALGEPMLIRIPVIPAVNDSRDNLKKTAEFIRNELVGKGDIKLQLLGFMRLGEEKYTSLGQEYPMSDFIEEHEAEFDREALNEKLENYAKLFTEEGIQCIAGTFQKEK